MHLPLKAFLVCILSSLVSGFAHLFSYPTTEAKNERSCPFPLSTAMYFHYSDLLQCLFQFYWVGRRRKVQTATPNQLAKSFLSSILSLIKPWAIGCQINQVIEQQFMTFLWRLNLLSIHYVKVELGDTIPTIASLTCLGPAEYVLRTW